MLSLQTEATSNGKANGEINGEANGKANGHSSEGNGDASTAGLYKVKNLLHSAVIFSFLSVQVGEKVDAKDRRMGAWFEAQVVKVTTEPAPSSSSGESGSETTTQYHVKFDE